MIKLPTMALLGAAALTLSAVGARADVLCMRDGRIFDHVPLIQGEDTVSIEFEHGTITVPRDQVLECIFEDNSKYVPATEEEKSRFEKGQVRFDGRWVSIKKRDKLVAERVSQRRAEIEAIKDLRKWGKRHKEETKNFRFESTVPPSVFENYRDLFEQYYEEFAKTWKIRRPRDVEKLLVKFYVDRDAFLQVTGMPGGVLGFFRFIEPYELNIFYDRINPGQTEEVIYHELGHYLQKLIDVDFKYPHWPGESLSEFYAASIWDPVEKTLDWGGLHDGRIVHIQSGIEKDEWVSLKDQILGCQDRNFSDYSWGWSFVHFLMSDSKRAKNFKKFFLGLASARDIGRRPMQVGAKTRLMTVMGPDMLESFMKYMKIKNEDELMAMEKEWYDYINENMNISTARGFERAAGHARRFDRKLRAKRLYEQAIATGDASSLTYHLYADLLLRSKDKKAAHENWRKAIEIDPLVSTYYIAYGTSLIDDDEQWEEGERLLHLANEIDPDNFYLERNLEAILRRAAKKRARKAESEEEDEEEDEEAEGEGAAEEGASERAEAP